MVVERRRSLEKLEKFKDKSVIKIITGVRRSGKSTLLRQFAQRLRAQGVEDASILFIQLDRLENEHLREYHALYQEIMKHRRAGCMQYIFLDEVQLVPEFQRTVLSLFEQERLDLYLTGSNASLLSGELATLLSGRYVEIAMLPLSFAEYCELANTAPAQAWNTYVRCGGFPYLSQIEGEDEKRDYLQGIYHTVLLKDIIERHNVQDPYVLESLLRFLMDNVGNLVTSKKIADSLTSFGRKTSPMTVEKYLRTLEEAFILYRVSRFDIQGKQHLRFAGKYYVVDTGLRWLLLGDRGRDLGHVLENIVYLELLRRGNHVFIGKFGDGEIDFVAEKGGARTYYQVSASILDPMTYERELAPLKKIKDNYPKFILTLDTLPMEDEGIRQINLLDFLLANVL